MATLREPFALDRSLNTTESPSRNIADVLAEELSAMITAIGGLNFINFVVVAELPTTGISTTTIYLVPSDDPQSENTYDEYINLNGTVSGWEKIGSTDIDLSGYYTSAEVDDLLADKADVSDIPTVNDGTLTIQQNGETKGTFTANQSGNSTVNIEIPTTDIQTAVDEFETYNGGLLSSLKVSLSPIQDLSHGDPSPDNICPISGHTQADIWNHQKNLLSGIESGGYDSSGNKTVNSSRLRSIDAIPIESGETYIFTCQTALTLQYNFQIRDENLQTISDGYTDTNSFTNSVGGKYVTLVLRKSGDGSISPSDISNPQLELGSTATAYEPYNGYQVTVNLGGIYYSGTLNVVTGEFTVTNAILDLGDRAWIKSSVRHYTEIGVSNPIRPYAPNGDNSYIPTLNDGMCTDYVATSRANIENVQYGFSIHASGSSYITIRDKRYDELSGEDFKTAISGVHLCYKLATPQTIQLSPTMVKALVGENHLTAPLEGQEITESKYKQMFTFDDVIAYIQSLS